MIKSILKPLQIAYYGILVAALLFATLCIYLSKNNSLLLVEPSSLGGQIIQSFVILYTIVSIAGGLFWFKTRCKKTKLIDDENEKLGRYKHDALIRIIVIGVGMLFGIVAFYILGGFTSMIWCAAISAIGLIFCKPNEMRIQLELLKDEQL
ncbi:MAG: hypothetical protein IJS05_05080 [Paludibacteraceae bacterium]|nr:hypothetical protein [Paludibacteraceae bacterium]